MARAVLGTAVFVTSAGMAWVFIGTPYLLETSDYGLLAFLWITHFLFWLGYLGLTTPILVKIARRSEPRETDPSLASLLMGAGGIGYVVWATRQYLHRDLGFFTPSRLALNAGILLGLLAAAAILFASLRAASERSGKVFRLVPILGVVATGGFWTFTLTSTMGASVDLDLADLQPVHGGASRAGVDGVTGEGRGMRRRVTILGLDGADWRFVDALIAKGDLPHFSRFRQEGVTASMETVSPFSPVDWTTIATGVGPERHSVHAFSEMYWPAMDLPVHRLANNFLEPLLSRFLDKIPVSSATRTEKTLWEIASAFDVESLAINWWATFPVSPHDGILISNYALPWDELSAGRIAETSAVPHLVYPDEIWPEVASVMDSAVEGGVSVHTWRGNALDQRMTNVDFWNLRDRIVEDLYEKFKVPEQFLTMIYYQGIDTTCHHYSESVFGFNADIPREPGVGEDVIAEQRTMIDDAYRRMDRRLGSLMEGMERGDLLVVVSDHGWNLDGTSHWRKPDAIFGLYGESVRKGLQAERQHLMNVAPTVLYYLGLPISRELQGEILTAAFTDETLDELPLSYVASYGPRNHALRISKTLIDAAHKKMLTPLGYR